MKLEIGPNLDNNKVRLDFRKSPDKPANSPSYEIDESKADEFVKKYNAQEDKLKKRINLTIAIFAIAGWALSIYKKSLKIALLWVPAGIIAGLGIGALISAHQKNNLMDKYEVREYSIRSYF